MQQLAQQNESVSRELKQIYANVCKFFDHVHNPEIKRGIAAGIEDVYLFQPDETKALLNVAIQTKKQDEFDSVPDQVKHNEVKSRDQVTLVDPAVFCLEIIRSDEGTLACTDQEGHMHEISSGPPEGSGILVDDKE